MSVYNGIKKVQLCLGDLSECTQSGKFILSWI